jgi:predicted GNAT family acetyltransferase
MLSAFRNVLAERARARFFVVRDGNEIVAIAELYPLGDVAQVEAVYTLEAFRGRGFGRAVVLVAAKAARDAGADLVFLNADDEDWPKALYGKLGFDELGRFWSFVKSPD